MTSQFPPKMIQWMLFLTLALILLAGCSSQQPDTQADQAQPAQTTPTSAVALPLVAGGGEAEVGTTDADPAALQAVLTVILPDGTSKGFSLAELEGLPQATISVGGVDETGARLTEVLKAVGVTEFTTVTLTGSGSLALTPDQVTQDAVLGLTDQGTVKFASTNTPKTEWPQDIVTITVK